MIDTYNTEIRFKRESIAEGYKDKTDNDLPECENTDAVDAGVITESQLFSSAGALLSGAYAVGGTSPSVVRPSSVRQQLRTPPTVYKQCSRNPGYS